MWISPPASLGRDTAVITSLSRCGFTVKGNHHRNQNVLHSKGTLRPHLCRDIYALELIDWTQNPHRAGAVGTLPLTVSTQGLNRAVEAASADWDD